MKQCPKCKLYKTCTTPCREVEDYINQDYNEGAWMKIKPKANIDHYQPKMEGNLSTSEIIFQNFFLDHMSISEIAKSNYKSRQYVHRVVRQYEKIIIENAKKTPKTG